MIHDGFGVERVAAALESDRVTLVSLVATQLARLLDAGADVAAPRAILLGGGPLPLELLDEATRRGATVVQTYGMTETCSQVATLSPADAKQARLRPAPASHRGYRIKTTRSSSADRPSPRLGR